MRTSDSVKAVDKKNPLVFPNKGFEFDVTEQIAPLPCGMPAFYLGNSKGVRADKAPDNVIKGYIRRHSDGDQILNVGVSCIDCHLRAKGDSMVLDMDYANPRRFSTLYSPEELEDLERQYFRTDIFTKMKTERIAYAGAIREATGFEPEEYGEKYTKAYSLYRDRRWHLGDAAGDQGMTAKEFLFCLAEEEKTNPKFHPNASVIRYGGQLPTEQYEETIAEFHAIRLRHEGKLKVRGK